MLKPPRQKKCKVCPNYFSPISSTQVVCCWQCAIEFNNSSKAKAARKDLRVAKLKIKTKAQWNKEAQAVFNKFIRIRDADLPCISCGRFHEGQYHCGHYLSRGSSPHLRFCEENCHKQCAPCNLHLSGNIVKYRQSLIQKIGLDRVEWLESNQTITKYTIDDLKHIIEKYKLLLAS